MYIFLIVVSCIYYISDALVGRIANMCSGIGVSTLQGLQFLYVLILAIMAKAFEKYIINAP